MKIFKAAGLRRWAQIFFIFFSAYAWVQNNPTSSKSVPKKAVVYTNGNIYSFSGQRAKVIVVYDGKVLSVGGDEILTMNAPDYTTVDLHGAFVMPGFNDAHAHLASGGQEMLNVNLLGTKSLAEMMQRIAARAKTAAPGEWLIGGGWDHTKWDKVQLPTLADLDAVTVDHPAIFTRVDGHISVANSAALKLAGLTKSSVAAQGGAYDHDDKGELTGIIRETARGVIFEKIPELSKEKRRKAIELALADAAEHGVTSAQDNSGWEDFLVYEELEKEGKLALRISEWLPFDAPLEKLIVMRAHHDAKDPMLHTTMLKGFMDGSLGSRTATLLAPYNDDPKNSGIPRYKQEQLDTMTAERVAAVFQIGFHAIGDRGTEMALNSFEKAGVTESQDLRFRIEHAQVTTPEQFARFKKLGVIASMQPSHLLTDMNWAESRIGAERAKSSYGWKQFLDAGVHLAFGTDYPVEPITPFRGIYAAVTRKNEEGTKTYVGAPLTIDQAIAAYTTGSAYAEYAEKWKGTLSPGMAADFVVLDRDITKVKPEEILKTKVLRTVVGGKTVYESK